MNKQGLLLCTSFASPPNSLHYCGPDNTNISEYQKQDTADRGLELILNRFETLYPYLCLIAYENDIKDPFDPRVVEAYWIGNSLLSSVSVKKLHTYFSDILNLKDRLKSKDLQVLFGKLDDGILPHHTHHVLNIFVRTGHHATRQTVETMDNCRIGWGTVIEVPKSNARSFSVLTQSLILEKNVLVLAPHKPKTVFFPEGATQDLQKDSLVAFHWNMFCTQLSKPQASNLIHYTKMALHLANKRFDI